MSFDFIKIFSNFPPELATFFISMVPVFEIQASIPIALTVYKLSLTSAYVLAIAGNLVPALFLLLYLDPMSKFLMERSKFFYKFFQWIFHFTRGRFIQQYLKYGELALFLYVAIPTPLSGVWSSSVAAFLFGIPFRRAFLLIVFGELIAAAIISSVVLGAFTVLR